jgi:hypothetical protein
MESRSHRAASEVLMHRILAIAMSLAFIALAVLEVIASRGTFAP